MGISLITIGVILLIASVRDTLEQTPDGSPGLFPLLVNDFEPGQKGNFLAWFIAIVLIGAVGIVPQLKPISTAMLVLVILVLLISNGGFFKQLEQSATQKAA